MPTKGASAAKYAFNPDRDQVILRFPTGLYRATNPEHFRTMLKLVFQAMVVEIKTVACDPTTRLWIKPMKELDNGMQTMLSAWITQLISHANPNQPKEPLPQDVKDMSLTLFFKGFVYRDIYPVSNRPNEEGYYEFIHSLIAEV
jgi:hypothetical protein